MARAGAYDALAVTTMLIVDDDAAFRRVAGELLAGLGFRVVGEACDGEQAIAAAARLRPDAVLLDVQLPDADGFSLARRLTPAVGPLRVLLTSTDAAAGSAAALEAERLALRGLRYLLMSPRLLFLLTSLRTPHAFELYCDWIDAQPAPRQWAECC